MLYNCGKCKKNFQVKVIDYAFPYNFCPKHFSVSHRKANLFKKNYFKHFFKITTHPFFLRLRFLNCGRYGNIFQVKVVLYGIIYNYFLKPFLLSQRLMEPFKKTNSNFFWEYNTTPIFRFSRLRFLNCVRYENNL